jgi:hypothetical protein
MDERRSPGRNADEQANTSCRKVPASNKAHLDKSTHLIYTLKRRLLRDPVVILVPSLIVGVVVGFQIIMYSLNRRILCAEIKQRLFDVTSV